MQSNKRLFSFMLGFIVLVVVVLALDFFFFKINPFFKTLPVNPSPTTTSTPPANPTTDPSVTVFNGTLQCLSSQSDCPFGLKTQDGKIYSLTGLSTQDLKDSDFKVGQPVEIRGKLSSDLSSISITSIIFTM